MAGALTKLKGFIQTYAGFNFEQMAETDFEELKNFVSEAVLQLRWEIEDELANLKEDADRSQYVKNLQAQLTYLSDDLTGFEKGDKGAVPIPEILEWVLFSVFELLDHIRVFFPTYFDFSGQLPSQFIIRYKSTYNLFREDIIDNFTKNNVDPELTKLIASYVHATDNSERFKIRTWRQWDFLINTMKVLTQFIDSPPQGDITLELLKLFICREFNSIHVYAYFVRYIERITLEDKTFLEQQQELLYLLKTFRQVRVEAQHFYDPNIESLKISVVESLQAELTYLEDKEKLYLQTFKSTKSDTLSKFYFTVVITLAELMFFFRIMLKPA